MREIKFRAWDRERNEFLSGGEVFIAIQPGRRPQKNIIYLDIIKDPDMYKHRFVLQQYICLHDRNGKEVYEGDIVSVWRDGSNRIFAVKWRDTGVPMYILYPQPLNENFWHCRTDMEMAWEVIGNIYENPKLLTSE
jgi:hypothetical protein